MNEAILGMGTQIVCAALHNTPGGMPEAQLPKFIETVMNTLHGVMASKSAVTPADREPAVPIKESVTPDYLICLEDGKQLKMLRRYLRSRYNLTPDQYREKWGLLASYPMCAPNYAALRSEHAKKIGLGRAPQAAKKPARKAGK